MKISAASIASKAAGYMWSRAYRLYEKRACNFHSDRIVGKNFNCATNVGGAKWKPFSSPVNATLVLLGVLGSLVKGSLLLLSWF